MDITIEILGRATLNDTFSVIGAQTVTLADEAVAVVPAVPPEAAGQDLRLRLLSPVQQAVNLKRFVRDASGRPSSIGAYTSHGGQPALPLPR